MAVVIPHVKQDVMDVVIHAKDCVTGNVTMHATVIVLCIVPDVSDVLAALNQVILATINQEVQNPAHLILDQLLHQLARLILEL